MAADLELDASARGSLRPIASINVTPFVDVVLVLLVIFMVTAPILMKEVIAVRLPQAARGEQSASTTFGVAITRQGQILLNGKISDEPTLEDTVRQALKSNADLQVVIAADEDSRHADLVRVIDLVKSAGVARFALQIRKPNH